MNTVTPRCASGTEAYSGNKYRVIFMGTPEFAVPALQALLESPRIQIVGVITQPDKPVGRAGTPQPSPIKQLALKHNLPVWTPAKLKNNSEIVAQIAEAQPDTIVVAAYGKIIPQAILDIPLHGIVNVHGSLLPKYRGASPITAAILRGDTATGVTLMKMVFELDAGPIIITSNPIPIAPDDTTGSLTTKLALAGASLLQENLIDYLDGKLQPTPQDETMATYTKIIHKADGKIDWTKPADYIEHQTRGYSSWPSAYTFWDNQLIKIIRTEVVPSENTAIGQVWQTHDNYPAVVTGQNSVKLLELQLAGKKPTSGQDFLRGHPNFIGTELK